MPVQKVAILGTAGNCIDILDTLNDINAKAGKTYQCVGFLDDNPNRWGSVLHDVPVLGPLRQAAQMHDVCFVNGIGSPTTFWKKPEIIAQTGVAADRFLTVVHPTASVSTMSRLGRGTVIFQNVTITSNVTVGDHVIVLPNSVISHDDVIGDYCCIAGGVCISGNVTVGDCTYIGTNAAIMNGVRIGSRCLIGMSSVVLKDVDDNTVVAGNPARILRTLSES